MKRYAILSIASIALAVGVFLAIGPGQAAAASATNFQAGNIIDDAVFYNSGSMTAGQIQTFLSSQVPTCDTNGTQSVSYYYNPSTGQVSSYPFSGGQLVTTSRATEGQRYDTYTGTTYGALPFTCLKDYSQTTTAENAVSGMCSYLPASNNDPTHFWSSSTPSAAEIISKVSSACNINPQVMIVLLQKEQGLVTDDWPWNSKYQTATGYACPDTSGCNTQYYGFFNQVYNAALQFQEYKAGPTNWNYVAGQNNYILYNPNQSCGGSWVYIQNEATAGLYDYTPYQPNQAAINAGYGSGDGCSSYGNRNFYLYFTDWFGNTLFPTAFKTSSSGLVYIQTNGYKFSVPSMAVLQDFGISPTSIQTISQTAADAVPSPDPSTGLSSSIGSLIKSSSSATVYLVSAGYRYAIQSMQQFNDFGFNTNNIVTLPVGYVDSIRSGNALSNFIGTPSSNVFQVGNAQKRIIFDQATFSSLDPSGASSFLSDYVASLIPSGSPIANQVILVRSQQGTIYLFDKDTYYYVPSMAVFGCWGFSGVVAVPDYTLADDSYIGAVLNPAYLSCAVNTDQTTAYLLNGSNKLSVPASFGFNAPVAAQDLVSLVGRLPTREAPLGQVIQASTSTVWYVEQGVKKYIPSMSDFALLHLTTSQIDHISDGAAGGIPSSGFKVGVGQVVKPDSSGAVYVITSNSSRLAFASGDDFSAYGFLWPSIESFPAATLDQLYPAPAGIVSKYLYDQTSASIYLMDINGCYKLNSSELTSYGKSQTTIQSSQSYSSTIFPYIHLGQCANASVFVKSPNSATVYWIDGGQRHPVSSWASLVNLSHSPNPYIINLSDNTLATIPVGSTQ